MFHLALKRPLVDKDPMSIPIKYKLLASINSIFNQIKKLQFTLLLHICDATNNNQKNADLRSFKVCSILAILRNNRSF